MAEVIIIDGVYALKKKLGKGGMAVVYLADVDLTRFDYTTLYAYTQVQGDTHTERRKKAESLAAQLKEKSLDLATMRVVLETQNIPLPAEQVAVKIATGQFDPARFEGEWKNLMCLNNPNVVQVYGGGIYMKRPYYAMELLSNIVAPKRIRKEFTIRQKLEIVIQAGRGLAYLHENGLIHRDVKPDNFVTCEAAPGECLTKVTDLGIAKNIDDDLGLTMTQAVMGTPYYMSPEQVASSKNVDFRADIYSLGASLYELVTGLKPFHDKTTVYQIIYAISQGETPVPPQQHLPELPQPICSIINCAMAREPDDRYQSMAEMVADLETYLGEESKEITGSITYMQADLSKIAAASGGGKYVFEAIGRKAAQRQAAGRPRVSAVAKMEAMQGKRKKAPRLGKRKPAPSLRGAPGAEKAVKPWMIGAGVVVLVALIVGAVLLFGGGEKPGGGGPGPGGGAPPVPPVEVAQWRIGRGNSSSGEFDDDPHDESELVTFNVGAPDSEFPCGVGTDIGSQRSHVNVHFKGSLAKPSILTARWSAGGSTAEDHFDVYVNGAWLRGSKRLTGSIPYRWVTETFELPPQEGDSHVISFEYLTGDGNHFDYIALAPAGAPVVADVPKTEDELHAALRAANPDYTGEAQVKTKDGKIVEVRMDSCGIRNLSPLAGMPLTFLYCDRNRIEDLSPLEGTAIASLTCRGNRISNLSPLRDLPLTSLNCTRNPIKDLSPISNLHLELLRFEDTDVTDLTPLAKMRLEAVSFTPGKIVRGIDVLRNMTSIKKIGPTLAPADVLPPAEFWKKYDAGEFGAPPAGGPPVPAPPTPRVRPFNFRAPEVTLFYDFNDVKAGVVKDRSPRGDNGSIHGAGTIAAEGFGKALRLDGKNDYVDCGSPPPSAGSITVSAWVKTSQKVPTQRWIVTRSQWNARAWQLTTHRGKAGVEFGPGGQLLGKTDVADDKWHHILGLYDAETNERRLYVDGEPDGVDPGGVFRENDKAILIGVRDGENDFFEGLVDNVAVFQRCLSDDEIRDLSAIRNPADVPPEGHEVHTKWPFGPAEAKRRQEETAKALGIPVEKEVDLGGGVTMKLVLIPAGEFLMGATDAEAKRLRDESAWAGIEKYLDWQKPAHRVRITRPFLMDRHEVTVGAFREFVRQTGHKTRGEKDGSRAWKDGRWRNVKEANWRNPIFDQTDRHPVTCVDWDDAKAFCEWLDRTDQTKPAGHHYRLPTEAEWEYAARGPDRLVFPWGNELDYSRFNFPDASSKVVNSMDKVDDGHPRAAPVGSYSPRGDSPFGIADMKGNVWEWCEDCFSGDFYARSARDDPLDARESKERSCRGGSWADWHSWGTSFREGMPPVARTSYAGFRVVLAPARGDDRAEAADKKEEATDVYRGPKNAAEMHRALKARNPGYEGNGAFTFDNERLVAADITQCKLGDMSPLAGITTLTDLRCTEEHERLALKPLHEAWRKGKIDAVKKACEEIVSGWKNVEAMSSRAHVVNPVGQARWMADNLDLLGRLSRRIKSVPPAASEFGGHSYLVFGYGKSWPNAKALAEALGGHLAAVTTAEEDKFARDLLRKAGLRRAYIGLFDRQHWRWVTGEPWQPQTYNRLEGAGGDYGFIDVHANVWSTESHKDVCLPFIIEWDAPPKK